METPIPIEQGLLPMDVSRPKGQRLPKFKRRPELIPLPPINERVLNLLATIADYQLIPTSLLMALDSGSAVRTQLLLQRLYHHGFVNRFSMARLGGLGEIVYYLDNKETLELLDRETDIERERLPWKLVDLNRKSPYAALHRPAEAERVLGRLPLIDHELRISRFHAHLALACRHSDGQVVLANWQQGPAIEYYITVPKLEQNPRTRNYYEGKKTEKLPLRPDAFFSLRFPEAPEGQQNAHFFLEADRRRSTDMKKFRRKARAYFHAVVKQRRQGTLEKLYDIPRIRAVLFETPDDAWAQRLRRVVAHYTVSEHKPSPLFWFASNQAFIEPVAVRQGKQQHTRKLPRFLVEPQTLFEPIWKTPNPEPTDNDPAISLLD